MKYKWGKRKNRPLIMIVIIILVLGCMFGMLMALKKNEAPTLIGTWHSLETGEKVTFEDSGKVIIGDNVDQGSYHIISPTSMEYTIDNYQFTMFYKIEEGKLYWGVNENELECFKK